MSISIQGKNHLGSSYLMGLSDWSNPQSKLSSPHHMVNFMPRRQMSLNFKQHLSTRSLRSKRYPLGKMTVKTTAGAVDASGKRRRCSVGSVRTCRHAPLESDAWTLPAIAANGRIK